MAFTYEHIANFNNVGYHLPGTYSYCIFETCYNGTKTHYCYEIHSTNFDRRKHVHIKMQPPLTGFEPVIFYLYFGHRGKQCKLSKIIVLQYVFNCIKTIPCTICVQCQRGLNAGLCHPFIFTSKPHFAITKTVTPKKSLHSKF